MVLRSHQRHRMRLVLVCLSISVGVAFLAGTFILTDTDSAAIAATSAEAYAHVAVAVQGFRSSSGQTGLAGFKPVPAGVLSTVRDVAGVARAQGEVDGYAQLVADDGTLIGGSSSAVRGISVGPVARLRPFVLKSGRFPTTSGQVVVDAHTFATQGWRLGQQVRVVTDRPTQRFTVVGTISSRRSSDVLGSTLVGFTVPTAQRLLGTPGAYSVVLAASAPGVSDPALVARVAAAVEPGYYVVTGDTFRALVTAIGDADAPKFSTVLDVVLGIALFVGALVIFNIISIAVSQRRRELALVRCLGASRVQVYRSVLVEAAVLGLAASVVGLGLGIAAAALLQRVVSNGAAQTTAAPLVISLGTVLISLVVGTVVTGAASVLPAVAASRIPPVSALRQDAIGEVDDASSRWRTSGLALAAAGLVLVGVGLFVDQGDRVELGLVGLGMALGLTGLARLSPLIIPPLVTVLGWPLRHPAGLPGHLGRQNAIRNPRRTAVTAAALIIGVALVSLLAIIETSQSASSNTVLSQALTADFEVLHAGAPPFTDGPTGSLPLSPAVLARLRAQPELVVSPFSYVRFLLNGAGNFGAAVDPRTIGDMYSFGAVKGNMAGIGRGGVAVSAQQAAGGHLHVGQEVNVAFLSQVPAGESTTMRVVAIYPRGDIALSGYVFSTATAYGIDPSLDLNAVLVKAGPGVTHDEAERAVRRATAGFSDVSVQDLAQVQAGQNHNDASELNLISALLVLAIAVALLGIINTMALSVVERTRELALLRAVGMSRAQMRSMVRFEAALIGMVGALLGVVLGLFLGWVFQRALISQGITQLVVPWARLVIYVLAGAATGFIAGTIPARRAARVDMLHAIAAE
ncbi:MAG: ABC transporter permease [Acidimicrobiales bacterium]